MPGWSFVALDASGRSGGLVLGIKDCSLKLLNSWGSDLMLGAEVYSSKLCSNLLF